MRGLAASGLPLDACVVHGCPTTSPVVGLPDPGDVIAHRDVEEKLEGSEL